jgi:ABC-2 type transport system permease protein
MTDSRITQQDPSSPPPLKPRHIGRFNRIGFLTLISKEVGRFANVYMQTILSPMITTLLFITIFSLAFGGADRMVGDVPYMTFLAPGLVMMAMVQNAFANTSSSIMISKVQGNIVDVLMPPLSTLEILLAYVIAGVIRGFVVGLSSLIVVLLFVDVHMASLPAFLGYSFLGCLLLSTMGVAAGLWSEKFDHLSALTNFVIMPLTFLSGTFYSIHVLPEAWQHVAHANPFFYMIDGFRYSLSGHAESNLWMGFWLLVQLNVAFLIFSFAMLLTGYKVR